MGLLDEAIREHLELKRRRGADPTEVERLEREALGPVRRGPRESHDVALHELESAPAAYADHEPGVPDYPEHDEMADEWDEPPTEAPVFDHEGESDPVREAPRHHEIAEEWDAHEPLDLQEPPAPMEELNSHEPARAETPPPAAAPRPGDAPPPGPAHGDHLGEETAEFDVEAEEFEDGEGDDVLEETPEFLQDTPDHDRLWFEQRPPRDFDFDG